MRVDRVVDRYGTSLTPGVKLIWAVDQGSGGHRLTHATSGGARLSGILPGYSCKEGRRVEDRLLVEFPCTPTRTRAM
jgi:hypothetical protein